VHILLRAGSLAYYGENEMKKINLILAALAFSSASSAHDYHCPDPDKVKAKEIDSHRWSYHAETAFNTGKRWDYWDSKAKQTKYEKFPSEPITVEFSGATADHLKGSEPGTAENLVCVYTFNSKYDYLRVVERPWFNYKLNLDQTDWVSHDDDEIPNQKAGYACTSDDVKDCSFSLVETSENKSTN